MHTCRVSAQSLYSLRSVFGLLACAGVILGGAFSTSARSETNAPEKILGMYVHQHWPYNHPYAARTWTLADWRVRQALAWSFLSAMVLLGLISEWLAPGWVRSFLAVVQAYRHYTYGHSLFDVWFRGGGGPMAGAALLLAALFLCWRERSQSADSRGFFLATSLAMGANLVVSPSLAPHAQMLLFPGFLALLSASRSAKRDRLSGMAAWMLLAWPWVASFGLLLAAVWLPLEAVRRFWEVPLYTSPLLPLGITLAVGALLGSNGGRHTEQVPL